MIFASPILAILAGLCAGAVLLIGFRRRIRLSWIGCLLLFIGLISLALAAGTPSILRPTRAKVLIMVDSSASTRGATYRDNALIFRLEKQFNARIESFGEHADETVFSPPDADAILLFSDGQFDLPAYAPPTYPIVDPGLLNAKDASIMNLEFRDREIVATVRNNTDQATLTFSSNPSKPRTVPSGTTSISDALAPNSNRITAQIVSDDVWPENNALTIATSPPMNTEQWWVGSGAPSQDWRTLQPADLPTEPNAYLRPRVIVLNETSADSITPQQSQLIEQYVHDLGGTLILSNLQRQPAYSPLSDFPPGPQRRWVILCDQSGSMSQRAGDATRLTRARDAIAGVLATLPPEDRLDIGGFARDLSWWTSGKRVRETTKFTPPSAEPSGPTNLEAILRKLLETPAENLPAEVLLITDAEAQFGDVSSLIASLKSANTRVHLLQIAEGSSAAMDRLVAETRGQKLRADARTNWATQLQSLAAGALPDRLISQRFTISLAGESFNASSIRQTWLKKDASLLSSATVNGQALPAIAKWHLGEGVVIAIVADSVPAVLKLASAEAAAPRDARFRTSIETGEFIRIHVDAVDGGDYLNGVSLRARLGHDKPVEIHQTAPGRYEAQMIPPRASTFLTILKDNQPIDRIAVAGRYPREFASIGFNRANLQRLADQTGGRLIDPAKGDSLDIFKKILADISAIFLIISAGSLAGLLILWKLGRLSL